MNEREASGGTIGVARVAREAARESDIHRSMRRVHRLRRVVRRSCRRALVGRSRSRERPAEGRFRRADVDRLLAETWRRFHREAPSIPGEPMPGPQMNVALACLTVSLFETLLAEGVERGYAMELVGDVTWNAYRTWGALARFKARLRSRDPAKRLRLCIEGFLRFPFSTPGYVWEPLPAENLVAFNMTHCPVADYFASRGQSELCVRTWCSLDFPLAEYWESRLVRSQALAAGDEVCDFRWIPLGGWDRLTPAERALAPGGVQ